MAGTRKYNRRAENYNKKESHYLHLHTDGGIPIKIDDEGKIHARGFVDVNDNLEFTLNKGTISCSYAEGGQSNYTVYHDLTTTPNYLYSTIVYDKLVMCFQNYSFLNRFYNESDLPKYQRLNKRTKKLIKNAVSDLANPTSFHYNYFKRGAYRYVEPEIRGTWLGPYNYDTYLKSEGVIQNIEDLIVVKSGKLNVVADDEDIQYGAREVLFTTGTSGHLHVETTSIPNHAFNYSEADASIKSFKFKNTGHSNLAQASTPVATKSGVAGLFTNGVFLHTVSNGKSYNNSGVWNENSFVSEADKLDECLGSVSEDLSIENTFVYHYKTLPHCFHSVDTGSHSPILGYAKDGYPIYGPVAYSTAGNSSSALKVLQPSYRLKQSASRTNGPSFDSTYVSGYYAEDYEYVNALGDLDAHNGRTGVTPDYPSGTYAYFATIDDDYKPKYPYVVGPTYYGKIDSNDGLNGPVTESPLYPRAKPLTSSELKSKFSNPAIYSWPVYGDTFTKTNGMSSEKIIFVSPHLTKEANGAFLKTGYIQALTSTGDWSYIQNTGSGWATFNGSKYMATGNGKFLIEESGYRFPSSDTAMIYGGATLSGNMYFTYVNLDGGGDLIPSYASKYVTGTSFYTNYSGHKKVSGKVHNEIWDGKIPAGTPFKIEHWAFNGNSIGFNGKIAVAPCVPHSMTSGNIITLAAEVSGYGETKEDAYGSAMQQATNQLKKENNLLLVNSGIKKENKKMRSWRKMKEKRANQANL